MVLRFCRGLTPPSFPWWCMDSGSKCRISRQLVCSDALRAVKPSSDEGVTYLVLSSRAAHSVEQAIQHMCNLQAKLDVEVWASGGVLTRLASSAALGQTAPRQSWTSTAGDMMLHVTRSVVQVPKSVCGARGLRHQTAAHRPMEPSSHIAAMRRSILAERISVSCMMPKPGERSIVGENCMSCYCGN